VPMGMGAAWKAQRILRNAARVVASELLCGAQGLEFLAPLQPGHGVAALYRAVRAAETGVPSLAEDRPPAPDLERLADRVLRGDFAS